MGAITANTTWSLAQSPYQVTADISVENGATLAIEAGVVVSFDAARNLTVTNGALSARGTAGQPITFTSSLDVTGSVPAAGDWGQIRFLAATNDSATIIEHAQIRYGKGITVQAASPTFNYLQIANNLGSAISIDLNSSPKGIGNEASGNTLNGISVPAGDVQGAVTWGIKGIPYVVATGVVSVGNTPALSALNISEIQQGETINAILSGTRLTGAQSVSLSSMGTTAIVQSGATDTSVPIQLTASPSAALGAANIELQVAAGRPTLTGAVQIIQPQPTVTSLTPNSVYATQAGNVLNVTGKNFVAESVIRLDGVDLTTTYTSASSLSTTLPVLTAGNKSLTVKQPDPLSTGNFLVSKPGVLSVTTPPLSMAPATVTKRQGLPLGLVVSMPFAAPAGGTTVNLASSATAIATVPASVLIAEGATSAPIAVTTVGVGNAIVTASVTGFGNASSTLTITQPPTVSLPTVLTVGPGNATNVTVNLNEPAPAGGLTITLASSNTAVATVPASIALPAGATSGSFAVTALVPGNAALSASAPGYVSGSTALTVAQITIGVSGGSTGGIPQGITEPWTLMLSQPAPSEGLTVALSTADPTIATVTPATITIPGGATSYKSANITAVAAGTTRLVMKPAGFNESSAGVTSLAAAALKFNLAGLTVGKGMTSYTSDASVSLVAAGAPYTTKTALTVNLSSATPGLVTVPASVTIPAGSSSANFQVSGTDLTGTTPVNIDANAVAYNAPAAKLAVSVIAPQPVFVNLDGARNILSVRDDFKVQLTVPGAPNPDKQTAFATVAVDLALVNATPADITGLFDQSGNAVSSASVASGRNQTGTFYVGQPTSTGTYSVSASVFGSTPALSAVQTVNPPQPSISSINPPLIYDNASAPLTVIGQNFLPTAIVALDGVDLATTYGGVTQLSATIPAQTAGTKTITVKNPDAAAPGGYYISNGVALAVNAAGQVINGTPNNDTLSGGAGNDIINGLGANDTLFGNDGNDTVNGGDGADTLYGQNGNDVMNGGLGNDTIDGGYGNDTFTFDASFGQDTLSMSDFSAGKVDTVVFSSYASSDVASVERNVNNLVITFANSTDKLTLPNAFTYAQTYYRPDAWKFADGVTWTDADLKSHVGNTYGTAAADYLTGYDGATNIMYGYAGDDSLTGGNVTDTLYGGDGNDSLSGNAGDDTISGEAGNDTMFGDAGNDTLNGGIGNDTIRGGAGNDTVNGGDGADTLYGEDGNDVMNGGLGNDTIDGGYGNDTFTFDASFGQDTLSMSDFSAGKVDTVVFSSYASSDVASVERNVNNLVITFANSTDKLTLPNAFTYAQTYYRPDAWKFADGVTWTDADLKSHVGNTYGTAAADYLTGYDGATNIMYGYAGDDSLTGGNVTDTLYGGDGNDSLSGNAGDDTISGEAGNDTMFGDAGNDTLNGGIGNDTIRGGAGNDTVNGGDGADTLYGEDGNDVMNGGLGNDTIDGGYGNDTFTFDASFGQDTLSMSDFSAGKVDTVVFSSYASSDVASVERNVNNLVITFANSTDKLTLPNAFTYAQTYYRPDAWKFADGVTWTDADLKSHVGNTYGTAAADYLTGYDGATNIMYGYAGDDSLTGGNVTDTLYGGDGNDSLSGNAGDDTISGEAGNDTMFGDAGNDTLNGGIGNDTIRGGAGNDTVNGGDGADTLYGEDGNDVMNGGLGNDTIDGGYGNDTFTFDASFGQDTLSMSDFSAGKVDTVVFSSYASSDVASVERNVNNLVITFANSTDKLTLPNAFTYAQTYYRPDAWKFADGVTWTDADLKSHVGNTYGTAAADYLTGYDGATNIMYGYAGDDSLTGGNVTDTLYGGDGNDSLSGNAGDDTISGEAGNDTMFGDAGNDTLNGGIGNDTIRGGAGNDTVNGGDGADTLYGEDGNDVMNGGLGNDTIDGGYGNDTFTFDASFGQDTLSMSDFSAGKVDTVVFSSYASSDVASVERNVNNLVITFANSTDKLTLPNAFTYAQTYYRPDAWKFADGVTWTDADLKSHVGNTYGTAAADYLTGYDGATNIMYGYAGDDSLTGGNVTDTLYGGDGNDTLYGYAGNDTLDGGIGNDTVRGGDGNDTVNGGDGADALYGENGNDVMNGGLGNDTIDGALGNDTYVFDANFGQDTLSAYDYVAGKVDTVVFSSYASTDVAAVIHPVNTNNLVITFTGTTDRLTVANYFASTAAYYRPDVWKFSDGITWADADIRSRAVVQ